MTKNIVEQIRQNRQTKFWGQNIIYFDTIGSTNDEAKKTAADGAAEGTVLLAATQTGGKGRLNRSFFCPAGGLWFSTILHPDVSPFDAPKYTLLAAVAVTDLLRSRKFAAKIKWPNDVYLNGKKLTGILTETRLSGGQVDFVVLGIGINVNIDSASFSPEVRETATSLLIEGGKKLELADFMCDLMQKLEHYYVMAAQSGFSPIWDKWREYSLTLGQQVQVIDRHGGTFGGLAVDIDESGALLVKTADGNIQPVLADDVSVR